MSFLPYTYNPSYSPYPSYSYPFSQSMTTPSPIYTLLIIGMVLFMAANVMPNLIPAADRVWHVAPMVLQWGFIIIIFALMVQMLGIVPGVPQLHITYVHMAIASLLFILMWNHIVSEIPASAEEKRSSSSSSSREKPTEKKKEEKKEDEDEEPSPWDDLRSHPSAFLTTRLNKLMPWPFPLGRAARKGNELWWEKGAPSHVGHFNKPDPEVAKKAKEEELRKKKEKERAKLKEEEKAKEAEKMKEKEKLKKEAEQKAKMKEEEVRKAKEDQKRRKEEMEKKAVMDKYKQKLWRIKFLVMIVGIGLLDKTLGFLLLLLFSLQMVSQELNETPPAIAPSSSSSSSSPSSGSSRSSSSSSSSSQEEKEKLAKLAAQREKEKAAAAAAEKSKFSSTSASSRDPSKSSSSSSSSRSTSSSSGSSSSSSSKDKKEPISSDAIRKASGSKTVTHVDPDEGSFGVPYKVGFGMNYIHTPNPDKKTDLTLPSMTIPSTGMSHPLMTTTYRQYAN